MVLDQTPFDSLLSLFRYKWLLLTGAVVGLGVGIAMGMTLVRSYAYTTVVEIGKTDQLIETPDSCVAKLMNAYIPEVQMQNRTASDDHQSVIDLEVKNPRNSNLLVFTSKAPQADESAHIAVHQQVTDRLLEDHHKQAAIFRMNLEFELNQARQKLDELKDQNNTIALQMKLIEQNRALTNSQLSDSNAYLDRVTRNRESAGKVLSGNDQLLTLLMIDNQLAQEQNKRNLLQERLQVGLVQDEERVNKDLASNKRSIQTQEEQVKQLQFRLSNILETRVIASSRRSMSPVGLGRGLTALAVFLLCISGAMTVAFLLESHRKFSVQRQMAIVDNKMAPGL
jgi:uncharacterized protein involved in exopolysaccharide biosynthesis